jgi:hypothetical protein
MRDTNSLHKKMQEEIDCYGDTDYLAELGKLQEEHYLEEAALKWLALSILHGINDNAEKIKLKKTDDGGIKVLASYRKSLLPSPQPEVVDKVFEIMREITHIETDKGRTLFTVGVRDSSVDLDIKLKKKDDGKQTLSLKFPFS